MNVSEVMTREVVSVRSDATVMEAGKLMVQNRITGLPVVDANSRLVGIITERDFLRLVRTGLDRRPRWFELIADYKKLGLLSEFREERVGRVMTPNPVTISEDASIEDVLHKMERHSIKRLPVMRGTQLVGIVTRSDLLHAFMRSLRNLSEITSESAKVRQRMSSFERDFWLRHLR